MNNSRALGDMKKKYSQCVVNLKTSYWQTPDVLLVR